MKCIQICKYNIIKLLNNINKIYELLDVLFGCVESKLLSIVSTTKLLCGRVQKMYS